MPVVCYYLFLPICRMSPHLIWVTNHAPWNRSWDYAVG